MPAGQALDIATTALLALGLGAGGLLSAFLARALLTPGATFWPARHGRDWRHHTALTLFRVLCGAILAVAGLTALRQGIGWGNLAVGLPVMAAAYGVTLWAYRTLGLENTYGGAERLVTVGLYAYTRNPQYVSSVLASVGLSITAGSCAVLGLTAMLLTTYTLFALSEERILAQHYGRAFRDYMDSTPRFIGLRSLAQARDDVEGLFAR